MKENQCMEESEVISPLKEAAKNLGKHDLLSNFQKGYLIAFVREQTGKASYPDMVRTLEDCIRARHELHTLEQEMDQETFVNIARSGFLQRRGIDAKTKSPIYWIRYGQLYKNSWRIPGNSPVAKSHIRAILWFIEVGFAQTFFENGQLLVLNMDLNVGMLDFNIDIFTTAGKIIPRLFPVTTLTRGYIFGVPSVVPMLYNTACRLMPGHSKGFEICAYYEDVLDHVTCEDDVPEFWLDDEASVDEFRLDRTSTWCYERCLCDGNRVTTKDVLNPEPWPFAESAKSDNRPVLRPKYKRLDVIEE